MAAVVECLADTSVLARLHRPAVDEVLSPLIEAGLVATCAMVELEILYSARGAADHARRQQQLSDAHRSVALPDLLIAATAERHGVTLVHYDHDYDMVAGITAQPMSWVVPRGIAEA